MSDTTNKDRAYWAEVALEAFAGETMAGQEFSEIHPEDLECLWRDLITDLCHFARLKGWDFQAMIAQATGMHDEEAECDPDDDEEEAEEEEAEEPDEGQRIEAAFKASTHYTEGNAYDFHEEDGRWWVTERETGRGWGVSSGTGRDAIDGYLFEVLAQGE